MPRREKMRRTRDGTGLRLPNVRLLCSATCINTCRSLETCSVRLCNECSTRPWFGLISVAPEARLRELARLVRADDVNQAALDPLDRDTVGAGEPPLS